MLKGNISALSLEIMNKLFVPLFPNYCWRRLKYCQLSCVSLEQDWTCKKYL